MDNEERECRLERERERDLGEKEGDKGGGEGRERAHRSTAEAWP